MSRLRDNVERWLIHENYDFNQAKSEDAAFKITINNSDGLGNNTEVFEPKGQENILVIGIKIEMKTKKREIGDALSSRDVSRRISETYT